MALTTTLTTPPVARPSTQPFEDSLRRVIDWVQRHKYTGYEPADGNSSVFFPLTGGRVLPMRVLQQVVLRAPFNIRPFIGVRRHGSAIGRGYMAWGYLLMCRSGASRQVRGEAEACLDWLITNRAAGFDEFCWGDPYDYATRYGRRPHGAPLLIWSALIGQAFLEAFDVLGDQKYLEVAESVGRWVLKLSAEQTNSGACLSYNAYGQSSIHNANAMGAAFLARLAAITGNREASVKARSAMLYTCSRQRPDGSWYYAEGPNQSWIDNFHTAYILSALEVYRRSSNDRCFDGHLARGLRFFTSHFFEADGRAKYFHDQTYPVDIQCAAQAIETLVTLRRENPECLGLALKVAEWTIANLQAEDGHFYYRDLGWTKTATPMLHWGQGTMVKALALLVHTLTNHHD